MPISCPKANSQYYVLLQTIERDREIDRYTDINIGI